MRKRAFFCVLFLLCYTGFIVGQESKNNTVSGGFSSSGLSAMAAGFDFNGRGSFPIVPGLSIEYERMLHKNFSLAIDAGLHTLLFPYADIRGRWYPWAGKFFADIGLGMWGMLPSAGSVYPSLVVSPTAGWKIDIGNQGGWVLMLGISERVMIYYNGDISSFEGALFVTNMIFRVGYQF